MPAKTMEPRDPDWEKKTRASFARQTFMDTIGGRIAALSPGYCEVELPFRGDLCQQNGYLHGGVVTAIAANAAGYAAFSLMPPNSSVLGVDYKINLLDPAAGERFIAKARVLKPGRTLSVVECEVEAEEAGRRKLIAKMLSSMICLDGVPDEIRYKK
ncbi:MAG TPA: PaaI family thioesterase [Xanthobacteraceae bacterium]|nr:PaaI family thioesterase [Xanthobacteraceae bacterium]